MSNYFVVGVNTSHNGSLAVLDDITGDLIFYAEEERYSRVKRDSRPFILLEKAINELGQDIVALATSSCGQIDVLNQFTQLNYVFDVFSKYQIPKSPKPGVSIFDFGLSHHECHAYGGVYMSSFDDCIVIVVDGAGSKVPLSDGNLLYEFQSAYYFDNNHRAKVLCKDFGIETNRRLPYSIEEIKKGYLGELPMRFVTDNTTDQSKLTLRQNPGIVKVYEAVSALTGNRPDDAGKIMGLSSYGTEFYNEPEHRLFIRDANNTLVPNMNVLFNDWPTTCWINTNIIPLEQLSPENRLDIDNSKFEQYAKLAYEVQILSCQTLIQFIGKAISNCPYKNCKRIVISGGYGLNSVCNYELLNTFKDYELYFYPISHDGGTSIGAAYLAYLYRHNFSRRERNPVNTLYLGEEYSYHKFQNKYDQILQNNGLKKEEINDLEKISDLLVNGKTCALFQGRSEGGPRALGNRSILFNPTIENGIEIINKVKKREKYRPFAGTVLIEHISEWFEVPSNLGSNSDYMTVVLPIKLEVEEKIPAINHFGTCRIQSISIEQNSRFYKIIKGFYERTGIPIVGNTSFNIAGEPLVETISDALSTFINSDIDYLLIDNILISK